MIIGSRPIIFSRVDAARARLEQVIRESHMKQHGEDFYAALDELVAAKIQYAIERKY